MNPLLDSALPAPGAAPRPALVDRYGRVLDYLRIAVTERCNLRCVYCMPEEGVELPPDGALLTADEIARIVRIAAELGVRKVRLTGGEPLLRRDIVEIVERVASTPGIEESHLTTNGLLLESRAKALTEAGLTGVNVSLDSLDAATYRELTRRDGLEVVLRGLRRAAEAGIPTIKVNAVALAGITDREYAAFVDLTRDADVTVRFIELMPFDQHQIWGTGRFLSAAEMVADLRELYPDLRPSSGTSTEHFAFHRPGHKGRVAIIPAYTRDLCGSCSRLRVTADGKVRNCLYANDELDLSAPLRNNAAADEDIAAVFRLATDRKAKDGWHAQRRPSKTPVQFVRASMTQIGG